MKGYHCEGCGSKVEPDDLQVVKRASGCKLWLCSPCRRTTLALGVESSEKMKEKETAK